MLRVTHFEMPADDPERLAEFYTNVFGWTVEKWDGPVDYWLVMTGDEGVPGIDGGIRRGVPRPFLWGGERSADVRARASAGIGHAETSKPIQRRGIDIAPFGLPPGGLRPGHAEPGQVVVDRRFVFGAHARRIDILNP